MKLDIRRLCDKLVCIFWFLSLSTKRTFQDQDDTATSNVALCGFLGTKFVFGPSFWCSSQSLCPSEKSLPRNFISSSNVFSMTSSPLNSSGLFGRGSSLCYLPLYLALMPFMRPEYSRSSTFFLTVQIGFRTYQCVEVFFTSRRLSWSNILHVHNKFH